jgi:hypothetical protein
MAGCLIKKRRSDKQRESSTVGDGCRHGGMCGTAVAEKEAAAMEEGSELLSHACDGSLKSK